MKPVIERRGRFIAPTADSSARCTVKYTQMSVFICIIAPTTDYDF